ncbi:MAG: histidine phosphatase family protein [Pseudomonadota bacterium]|nr:histidine phosphatase family protein [Pseudomonadota bacterium]
MLQLTLIRHAKSSWDNPALSDFDRPLNKRGIKNAPLMGKIISKRGLVFDRIVTSPALRAITTAHLIAGKQGFPEQDIQQRDELYDASVDELLDCVHSLDNQYASIALVAHNPGLTGLCNYLSGESIANLPTCAVAVIEFDLDDWQAVYQDTGRLSLYEYPRKYTD